MKHIKLSDSFYTITYNDPNLRSILVRFGFKPMANDPTYNTIGRVITLEKALDHINKSKDELIEFLTNEGLEVVIDE